MKLLSFLMLNLTSLVSYLCCSNKHAVLTRSIENMLYTLHATYIKHNFYADFLLRFKKLLLESFLVTDSQFKMNKIFHCSDFNSLLLKHEM